MKTQHLVITGALVIIFGIAVVMREEIVFVDHMPDLKASQHAEFEATPEQKSHLQHLNTEEQSSNRTPATAAPLTKKPSSEKLGQADLDALMPGWLESKGASSDPVQPPIVPQADTRTTRDSVPPATEEKVEREKSFEQKGSDGATTVKPRGATIVKPRGATTVKPPGAMDARPPETSVPNCKACPPTEPPPMCSWLDPMKETPPAGRRLQGMSPSSSRRSLLAKIRTAFQSADRAVLAKSRQPNFVPPSAALTKEIREYIMSWRTGPACGFWTRECVRRYMRNETAQDKEFVQGIRRGPRYVFKDRAFPPDGEQFFPEVGRGELGACAVVAVADNLLGKKRGPEIDAHDTVIRYNGPMKAYTRDVGSKGDVYYWKQRRDEKQYGVEGQRANKFYMWKAPEKYFMFADKIEHASMTFYGKQMLWETGSGGMQYLYGKWAAENPDDKEKHSPSGGFKLAWDVISSGLCKRVDLYGFSAQGGGRYFKNAVVNVVHKIGLEHWSYRQAMMAGYGVCVYD